MWWLKLTNEHFWLSGNELSVVLICYVMGCFTTGYYLVRWRTGEDIRDTGSGNVGAKNVGRALGPLGFIITFLVDFAKGACAVWWAFFFGLGQGGIVLALLAVVAGHIWPAQLRLRGGKGIATSLGGLIIYDWVLVLLMTVLCLVAFAFLRRFTLSGLLAFAVSPLIICTGEVPLTKLVGISVLAFLVLIAHRKNLRDEIDRILARHEIEEKPSRFH